MNRRDQGGLVGGVPDDRKDVVVILSGRTPEIGVEPARRIPVPPSSARHKKRPDLDWCAAMPPISTPLLITR